MIGIAEIEKKTREWMLKHADTPLSQLWLFLIAFFEASVFPLPPSAFMLAMIALSDRRRWIYLATLTTIASVLGGLFGYFVGFKLYDTLGVWIITHYGLADDLTHIGDLFRDNAFLTIFTAAFTPIPYKAFTIAGGFFNISVITFTVASVLGRGIRFFAVAYLAKFFGEHFARSIFKYFALSTLVAIAIILAFVYFAS